MAPGSILDRAYELAGTIGIDPGGLTLRELVLMGQGRAEAEWKRTAAIMALMANLWAPRRPAWEPADFDPTAPEAPEPEKDRVSIGDLKPIFTQLWRRT
jgi:hypothetical protein